MSKIFYILTIISMVVGACVSAFMFLTALMMSPGLGALSMVLSAVYFAIVILLLSRLPFWPRTRPGQSRLWLYAALLWGGGISIAMTLPIGTPVIAIFAYTSSRASAASWGGAYPEEIVKTLGVLVICLAFTQLSRPWHGLLVGAVIGLGFETVENVLYGAGGAQMHQDSDWAGFWQSWALRVLAGPGVHIICTAIAGWGIGRALFTADQSRWWRVRTVVGWWLVAFGIHFAWNYDLVAMTPMVIKIIVIMAIMYFVFARLCIHSTRLYRADLGQCYTPAASLRQHPAGASVAKALVIAPETPRPSQEGRQLPSRHLRERPQPQSR